MKSIFELKEDGLKDYLKSINEPSYRSSQIFKFINNFVDNFDDMTNLPKSLRENLKQNFCIYDMKIIKKQVSKDKNASKYLIKLHDGYLIEAVRLKYKYGYSLCVSTQVGCKMGCNFCASTIGGKARDLKAYELIQQLTLIGNIEKEKITHCVLMGIGEPLDNYDEILTFFKDVNDEKGLNISHRRITMSTCGLVPEIKKLADENLQITLAISLHNPFNDERSKIMPINRKYPLEELIDAIDYYIEKTNRRVSIEYALIAGVNDSDRHLNKLVELLKDKLIHVNLIPINPIKERDYKPTENKAVFEFQQKLIENNINATVRRELGDDIDGACGQLRRNNIKEEDNL